MKKIECVKIKHRIECVKCGYPYSESLYPDNLESPLSCQATDEEIRDHLTSLKEPKEFDHLVGNVGVELNKE